MHFTSPAHAASPRLVTRRGIIAIGLVLLVAIDPVVAQRFENVGVAAAQRATRQVSPTRLPRSKQRTTPRACDSAWSGLRELRTPARQRVYVEAPRTVRNAVGTFLVGSPTYVWADSATFLDERSTLDVGSVGVRLLNDTLAIPLPPLPTATKPYMPIAVGLGAKLLAVWGTSADTSLAGVWHQDTLWEATLDRGRWSAARPVLTAGQFVWHPGAGSFLADDSSFVLAFPSTDTTRVMPRGVTVMMRSHDRWRTRRIDIGGAGLRAVAVTRVSPAGFLIAGVGSLERDTMHVLNGVYAIRLSGRDTTVEPRIAVIRDIRNGHAEDPAVFRTPHGEYVVWRQPGRKILADDSLIEASSSHPGEGWAVTSAISLHGDTRGLSVMSLGNGDAVAMALDIRRGELRTLRRTMEHWTLGPETFPDAKTIPMIAALNDRTTVSFGQVRPSTAPDGLRHDAPVLVAASRPHRCESRSAMPSQKRLRAPPRGKSTLR